MLCPHCNTPMQELTKTGVVIDLCPTCKGVWLDRGELEKIVSRAREIEREWEEDARRPEPRRREYEEEEDDRRYARAKPTHKKRSWTEIFDIFD
jgi:uncharacterized protein